MPELPEVETIKRGLESFCLHQKIKKVTVSCPKSFIGAPSIVENATIKAFRRFGKALIIDLSGNYSLMIHLRMTGQLIYRSLKSASFAGGHPTDSFVKKLPNTQTRVTLELTDGTLYFNDQRKFGFIKVLKTPEIASEPFIKNLGKEPWQITPDELYQKLQKHQKSPIKAVILDQKVIAGIGNIYADEALFSAKIHPKTLAGSLTKIDAKNIIKGAIKAMEASINSGGSTLATYVRADGRKGDYLDNFAQVFNREGQPCPCCGTTLEKIRVAGRGTHICPNCQKL